MTLARLLVQAAAARGVPTADLLSSLGIDGAALEDPERRLPHATLCTLWEELAVRAGDPHFGLHVAEARRPGAFDIIEYVFRSSPSFHESLKSYLRYQRLLHDASAARYHLDGDELVLTHEVDADLTVPHQAAEFILASFLLTAARMTGQELVPRRVTFKHAAPASDREHRRIFRVPVQFGAPRNEIALDRSLLDLPMPACDARLAAVLGRYAEEQLSRLPKSSDFRSEVGALVRQAMRGTPPAASAIARQLGMSQRSFSRRLNECGATFPQIIDDARCELAKSLLKNPEVKPAEVAFLLGFAEVSAFYRAFRRWTQTTPVEYRQRIGS